MLREVAEKLKDPRAARPLLFAAGLLAVFLAVYVPGARQEAARRAASQPPAAAAVQGAPVSGQAAAPPQAAQPAQPPARPGQVSLSDAPLVGALGVEWRKVQPGGTADVAGRAYGSGFVLQTLFVGDGPAGRLVWDVSDMKPVKLQFKLVEAKTSWPRGDFAAWNAFRVLVDGKKAYEKIVAAPSPLSTPVEVRVPLPEGAKQVALEVEGRESAGSKWRRQSLPFLAAEPFLILEEGGGER